MCRINPDRCMWKMTCWMQMWFLIRIMQFIIPTGINWHPVPAPLSTPLIAEYNTILTQYVPIVFLQRTITRFYNFPFHLEWQQTGRIFHNEKVNNLCSKWHIIKMIKWRIMRWTGHVACIEETRNTYTILIRKPEGKLGRSRRI